jgi:hypothetical protein
MACSYGKIFIPPTYDLGKFKREHLNWYLDILFYFVENLYYNNDSQSLQAHCMIMVMLTDSISPSANIDC